MIYLFRCDREVVIHTKDMSNSMADYAVECAHLALDKYGLYQSTNETLNNIAENLRDRYARRYNRGKWSCFLAKGDIECNLVSDKLLIFNIDGYYIVLIEVSE